MDVWKVYLITNRQNGKGYVGITSKSLELRMSNHIRDAFPGRRNSNGTLYALHAAFQKYGEENFSIRELEPNLSLGEARARERFYIRELGTYGGGRGRRGYNQTEGGELPDEAYGYQPVAARQSGPLAPKEMDIGTNNSSYEVSGKSKRSYDHWSTFGWLIVVLFLVYALFS